MKAVLYGAALEGCQKRERPQVSQVSPFHFLKQFYKLGRRMGKARANDSRGEEQGTMRNRHYYLGADLGGTSLRLGAVTAEGEIAHVLSAPTGRAFGPDE